MKKLLLFAFVLMFAIYVNAEQANLVTIEGDLKGRTSFEFSEGLAVFEVDGKIGYIDIDQNVVIEPRFDFANAFREGLAAVSENGSLWGYINTRGEYVHPPQYQDHDYFHDGRAVVTRNNKSFLVDKTGQSLTAAYDYMRRDGEGYKFIENWKEGYIDNDLKITIPAIYSRIQPYGKYVLVTGDSGDAIADIATGELVVPMLPIKIYDIFENMFTYATYDDSYGVMDFEQNIILQPQKRQVSIVNQDTFLITIHDEQANTVINQLISSEGEVIKELDGFGTFRNNFGNIVINGNSSAAGLWDSRGNEIIPCIYNNVEEHDTFISATKGDTTSIYDKQGTLVKQLDFQLVSGEKGRFVIIKDALFGVCDSDFNVIITPKYDQLWINEEGIYNAYNVNMENKDEYQGFWIIDKEIIDTKIPEVVVKGQAAIAEITVPTTFIKPYSSRVKYSDGFGLVDTGNPKIVPIVQDGRTFIPAYSVSNIFAGVQLRQDETDQAQLAVPGRSLTISADAPFAEASQFNENTGVYDTFDVPLSTPAQIFEEQLFVPLRATAELLGIDIAWHESGLIGIGVDEITDFDESVRGFDGALMSFQELPRIDGSLACVPFYELLAQNVLDVTPQTASQVTGHVNTHESYVELIDGAKDIIFVTQPSEEELAYAKEKGVELELYPFCNEGFVFLANVENPVEGLAHEQIQQIYTGQLTNWEQVGGENSAIIPYQRPTNSGSQTLMEQLVMPELTMTDAPMLKIQTMEGIIDAVAEYDNAKDALGYSVYFFTQEMHMKEKTKLLKINDVYPDKTTIYDRSYPYIMHYYAVIRSDTPENSKTRELLDFVLGEQGQELVETSGLVRLHQ